ncbi:MAG: hypothetical protein ABGY21_04435, partial [Pseudomonadota bacterium]
VPGSVSFLVLLPLQEPEFLIFTLVYLLGGAGHEHLISTMKYRIWYGRGEGRDVNEYMPWMHHIRPSFNDHLKQGEKYVFNHRGRSFWAGPGR